MTEREVLHIPYEELARFLSLKPEEFVVRVQASLGCDRERFEVIVERTKPDGTH